MPEFEVYSERVSLPDHTQLRVSILVTECPIKEDGGHVIIKPCATQEELDEEMDHFLEKFERARKSARASLEKREQGDVEKAPEVDLMPLPTFRPSNLSAAATTTPEVHLMSLPGAPQAG